jgi:hypothetical protein
LVPGPDRIPNRSPARAHLLVPGTPYVPRCHFLVTDKVNDLASERTVLQGHDSVDGRFQGSQMSHRDMGIAIVEARSEQDRCTRAHLQVRFPSRRWKPLKLCRSERFLSICKVKPCPMSDVRYGAIRICWWVDMISNLGGCSGPGCRQGNAPSSRGRSPGCGRP